MKPGYIVSRVDTEINMSVTPPQIIHLTRNHAECRCLICGNLLGMLTHCHAEKHGYKNKQEMIADGKVEFLHTKRGTQHE
jgi:hypothetical protein